MLTRKESSSVMSFLRDLFCGLAALREILL